MEWYYSIDGERTGPLSEVEFNAAVTAGTITAETLVWNDTMSEWLAYADAVANPPAAAPAAAPVDIEPDAPLASPDAPVSDDTVTCRECGTVATADAMAPYGEQWVCSRCKESFFQKIREGVNVDKAASLLGTGGETYNAQLMQAARDALTDKWGVAVATLFIFGLLSLAIGGMFQGISIFAGTTAGLPQYTLVIMGTVLSWIGILIQGPLTVGLAKFSLNVCDDEAPEIGDLFYGFTKFSESFSAIFLQTVILQLFYLPGQVLMQSGQSMGNEAVAAGFALFILALPVGIFFSLSWWMVPFVVADNEGIGGVAALKQSWNLMIGRRFKLFCLFCRFIGWFLLCIITCFIGFLWFNPYLQVALGMFYRDIQEPE